VNKEDGLRLQSGPLDGLRVIEMAAIGPAPMAAMLLADFGADTLRVDRLTEIDGGRVDPRFQVMNRSRRSVAVDLKIKSGVNVVLELADRADILIEGFRPGVMERLGLGPTVCMKRNPRLVYGRATGWGQQGPLAHVAAHDINFIAMSGALHAIGTAGGPPVPPLSLVGDFGGGGLFLALGVCAAVIEARMSGEGQVVDAAMIDGSASLMTTFYGMRAAGRFSDDRGTNLADSGAHFNCVYRCADGRYISVGAMEDRFYENLLDLLGLSSRDMPERLDPSNWPVYKERFAEVFAKLSRDEWCERLEGAEVCFAPVLDLGEAPGHPHNVARGTFVEVDGVIQPAPAPRFSRTPAFVSRPPAKPGRDTVEALLDWGISEEDVNQLAAEGAIRVRV
jgi:alpha-methylacyl-CoA racemase